MVRLREREPDCMHNQACHHQQRAEAFRCNFPPVNRLPCRRPRRGRSDRLVNFRFFFFTFIFREEGGGGFYGRVRSARKPHWFQSNYWQSKLCSHSTGFHLCCGLLAILRSIWSVTISDRYRTVYGIEILDDWLRWYAWWLPQTGFHTRPVARRHESNIRLLAMSQLAVELWNNYGDPRNCAVDAPRAIFPLRHEVWVDFREAFKPVQLTFDCRWSHGPPQPHPPPFRYQRTNCWFTRSPSFEMDFFNIAHWVSNRRIISTQTWKWKQQHFSTSNVEFFINLFF